MHTLYTKVNIIYANSGDLFLNEDDKAMFNNSNYLPLIMKHF